MSLTASEDSAPAPAPSLGGIRSLAPEVHERLERANAVARETVDPALLELARLRIGMILDPGSAIAPSARLSEDKVLALGAWTDSPVFSDAERACLTFVEQFVFYVADVDDALIGDLLAHLEPSAVYGFVNAVYVLDATERLRVSLDRLFGSSEVTL